MSVSTDYADELEKRIAALEAELGATKEWADRLAHGIAKVFGEEIGGDECNPWDDAMSILESACVTHQMKK